MRQVAGPPISNGNQVTVNHTNVSDAQTISISLSGVEGSEVIPLPMSVLTADTNGDRSVNSGDVLQTRSRSGQSTSATNFRSDVNVDGSINSGDATATKNRSGNSLTNPGERLASASR